MKKFWMAFALVTLISFVVLGYSGFEIYHQAPPIPEKVVTTNGKIVGEKDGIKKGQNVWQSMGGMEVGSIWGHGSYVAPDWTADWLHRESEFILSKLANQEFSKEFSSLSDENKSFLKAKLKKIIRTNTYDETNNILVIPDVRAEAFQNNVNYYSEIFLNGNKDFAIPAKTVQNDEKVKQLSSFFFWSSWAASTNRPGVFPPKGTKYYMTNSL